MGEGGALLIKDPAYIEDAEILREKGTDRSKFFRGEIDKYTWVEAGSSYLPSELNAAYVWAQFQIADKINQERKNSWNQYYKELGGLKEEGYIELPFVPAHCSHNGHMFYIKTQNIEERTELIQFLKKKEILTVFHYIPLHSSPAGRKYSVFLRGGSVYYQGKRTSLEASYVLWTGKGADCLYCRMYQRILQIKERMPYEFVLGCSSGV